MRISKFFTKTAAKVLETLFDVSGAKIRVHGEEIIPDQSALYVINHFTRIETTFLPYIIYKYSSKLALSLAHHSFFGGTFGKIMGKLGGVSTNDPERDRILITALLKGDTSVIIFPEGQMLKDKKLIEKGKYMVYNTGIRRPPHTGAARLALRTEFLREKLKIFHKKNDTKKVNEFLEYFDIKNDEIEGIINREIYIIPVNLTYFPIRAKNNAINKLADKFIKNISLRMIEEIEVEGTMLLEGVDIDIRFGRLISTSFYLNKSRNAKKKLLDNNTYLDIKKIKKEIPLLKVSVDVMYKYMDSIYSMTTINHDHIFSYILTMSPKNIISETVFKNKAFIAVEEIKNENIQNIHTGMVKNQFHLLTDDEHEIYNSFIAAASSDGLITVKDGYIFKHKDKFNKKHAFHTIRKNNIVEVIKNEIEPMNDILRILHRVMLKTPFFDRKNIRKRFLKLDNDLFEQDYKKYYVEGESKPKNIGRPFLIKKFPNKKGVILVHGYMAAPEEIRVIADILHKNGFAVYGARLRGHGTSPDDLAKREWIDWYRSVNRAYIIMENSVKNIAIAGFSTGAGIALLQAANKGKKFKGVISINAPLRLQNITSHLSSAVVMWNKLLEKIKLDKGKLEFVTNDPENPQINYMRNPLTGVRELGRLMNTVEDRLKDVQIPSLIIQGSNDPVVNPVSGLEIFDRIGTKEKEIYRIYSERHGIIRGKESEIVSQRVIEFLNNIF